MSNFISLLSTSSILVFRPRRMRGVGHVEYMKRQEMHEKLGQEG
jgi:hypothetical protein